MIQLLESLFYSMVRMFAAYLLSLLASIVIGVAMARNKRVESLLIPVLDILQSIPILGFFPIALLLLMNALPGMLGVELAIVFLITTSMVWNMIFGVYSSIKSLDPSIYDLIKAYRLSPATTFFRIYIPASVKAIVANSIISWAGGWFFITSSEIIVAGTTEVRVAGIGAYILDSFTKGNTVEVYLGVGALVLFVTASYILLWNPAFEEAGFVKLVSFSRAYKYLKRIVAGLYDGFAGLAEAYTGFLGRAVFERVGRSKPLALLVKRLPIILVLAVSLTISWRCVENECWSTGVLALAGLKTTLFQLALNLALSFTRVLGVVMLSLLLSLALSYLSFISIKSGGSGFMYIVLTGEVLASIPAILWWPMLSSLIRLGQLGVYTVSIIVFLQGSLWYSFFNIMLFGISSIRREVVDLADVYGIRGWFFVKHVFIPLLLPSIATSALSSWGGAWNSTIVAEYFSTDNVSVNLGGVGALMSEASSRGDTGELLAAVLTLSLLIAVVNKTMWKRLLKKLAGRFTVE